MKTHPQSFDFWSTFRYTITTSSPGGIILSIETLEISLIDLFRKSMDLFYNKETFCIPCGASMCSLQGK